MTKKYLLFGFLILGLLSCHTQVKDLGANEDLLTTISQFNTAFAEGDLDYLNDHTTDNYRHTNSFGEAFGKDSWFKYLKTRKEDLTSGLLKIEAYEMSEMEVQLHENAALVTGKIFTKGKNKEETFERSIRVTHFWIFENQTWKRAGFHDTRIQ